MPSTCITGLHRQPTQSLASLLLHPLDLQVNSGEATKKRAAALAKQIGADHLDVKVDLVVNAMAKLFTVITGKTPRFKASF